MAAIDKFLDELVRHDGSTLHLADGRAPALRLHGVLTPLTGAERIAAGQLQRMIEEIAPEPARQTFGGEGTADFAYQYDEAGRFRLHVFRCEGGLRAVARRAPEAVTLDALGLPPTVKSLTRLRGGLVIAGGPVGAGKTTTLGAMLREIDSRTSAHVVTVEDPIELVHRTTLAGFSRREVGPHTASLTRGLEEALTMSPDVVYVSTLPDPESASLAFTAAEAGILVLTSVVSGGVVRALERVVDLFPQQRAPQTWRRLAGCLAGAMSQVLVPTVDGHDRCPAVELLASGRAVAAAIRQGDAAAIRSLFGRVEGAQSLDDALTELVRTRRVRPEDAHDFAQDKAPFARLVER